MYMALPTQSFLVNQMPQLIYKWYSPLKLAYRTWQVAFTSELSWKLENKFSDSWPEVDQSTNATGLSGQPALVFSYRDIWITHVENTNKRRKEVCLSLCDSSFHAFCHLGRILWYSQMRSRRLYKMASFVNSEGKLILWKCLLCENVWKGYGRYILATTPVSISCVH